MLIYVIASHCRRPHAIEVRAVDSSACWHRRVLFGSPAQAISQWAFEDRLADLSLTVGHFSDLSDPSTLAGRRGSTAGPDTGLFTRSQSVSTNHLHVWISLLQEAGFTLDDIHASGTPFGRSGATRSSQRSVRPCDATMSGAGFNMSEEPSETWVQFLQFVAAEQAVDEAIARIKAILGE
jgi:hypothetical protein